MYSQINVVVLKRPPMKHFKNLWTMDLFPTDIFCMVQRLLYFLTDQFDISAKDNNWFGCQLRTIFMKLKGGP